MTQVEFQQLADRVKKAQKVYCDCSRLEQAMRDLRANQWPYDVLRKLTGDGAESVATCEELNTFIEQAIVALLRKRQAALAEL